MTRAVRVPGDARPAGAPALARCFSSSSCWPARSREPSRCAARSPPRSVPRSGRFRRRGCSPIPTMTRQRPRRRGRIPTPRRRPRAGRVEADVDADDPGTDDVPSLPPAERLFRAATRLLDDRPDSARAQRRAATFLREALELDPNHRAALTARPRASGGRGRRRRRRPRAGPLPPRRVARRSGRARGARFRAAPPDGPASPRTPRGPCCTSTSPRWAATRGVRWPWGTGTCTASGRPNRAPPRRCITRPGVEADRCRRRTLPGPTAKRRSRG